MKLPIANLGAVIAQWIDEELVSKAEGWQKAVTIMAGIGIASNAKNLIGQYIPGMKLLGFADDADNLNLDALHAAAKEAFAKTGKLPLPGGIIVGPDDVESIVAVARKYAVNETTTPTA